MQTCFQHIGQRAPRAAAHRLTEAPAELFGLVDRGRIAEGYHADLVLLDPETVGSGPIQLVNDLPGGTGRLFAEATGVKRVIVSGVDIVVDGRRLDGTGESGFLITDPFVSLVGAEPALTCVGSRLLAVTWLQRIEGAGWRARVRGAAMRSPSWVRDRRKQRALMMRRPGQAERRNRRRKKPGSAGRRRSP